ncbi:MAG: ribosome maturation factor RimM [Anaerolineales bacterium]
MARSASLKPDEASGSPPIGEPDFLVVGKLRRPHGVRGEILMDVYTDFPERLKAGVTVYIGPERMPAHIHSTRKQPPAMLIAFEQYESREQVGVLRNLLVQVRADDRPALPEGQYYHHQLLGMRVVEESGEGLGVLSGILETGANDVFVVTTEKGREILLPATDEVLLEIDLDRKQVRVHLLPGLI